MTDTKTNSRLPAEPRARKGIPLATGCIDYFPDALAAVAELSRIGNDQHNPGKPLHWDRSKSTDEADALMRHFVERGTLDTDGVRHSAKVAWRALALLQKEIEAARKAEQPKAEPFSLHRLWRTHSPEYFSEGEIPAAAAELKRVDIRLRSGAQSLGIHPAAAMWCDIAGAPNAEIVAWRPSAGA